MSDVLFRIVIEDAGVNAALKANREEVKKLNDEIKKVTVGTKEYREYADQLVKTKVEAAQLRDRQRELNKEFQATRVPTDSLAGLRLEYGKLTAQITNLSRAERESNFGKNLIKNAASVKKEIDGIEQSVGRFTGNVGNYKSALNGFVGILASAGVALGAGQIVEATRQYERLFAVLKNTIGNESQATKIFADIQQFAKETPFQLNELVDSFIKLENRNFNPTIEQLRIIGDIASSSGKTVGQFTEAILDAQTGEFERLKEFGIVARKNGDELKLSFRGQTETIKNTSEAITGYLLGIGKLPGIQGAAIAVSQTLDGSLSNLVDNFTQLFATIGSGGGIVKTVVDAFNSLLSVVNDLLSTPLSEELQSQQREFNALVSIIQDTTTSEEQRNIAIAELKKEYPEYLKFVKDDANGQLDLARTLEAGNRLFEQRILLQINEEKISALTRKRVEDTQKLTEALKEQKKVQDAGIVQRPGFARNEAGDINRAINVGTDASIQVGALSDAIKATDAEIARITDNANQTSVREFGKTLAELNAEINKVEEPAKSDSGGGKIDKTKKDAEGAVGSIEFLRNKIQKLTEAIDKSPEDAKLLSPLLLQLKQAEFQLAELQDRLDKLRNPKKALTEDQAIFDALGLPAPTDKGTSLSQREQAVGFTSDAQIQEEEARKQKLDELDNEYDKRHRERVEKSIEDEKKKREELKNSIIQAGEELAAAVFQIQANRIDNEENKALEALDKEYSKKIDAAQGNAAAVTQLEKEQAAKREQIEKEANEKRKASAKTEAIIQGAVAVVKALPNFILAALAAVTTAAQIAIIDSQQFAEGGKVKMGRFGGKPHTSGGTRGFFDDGTRVEVEKDEAFFVLNKRASADIRGLSELNARHGGKRFADGGSIDFIPQVFGQYAPVQSSVSASASFSREQSEMIGKIIADEVSRRVEAAVERGSALGVNKGTRDLERQNIAEQNRQI